jgi:hypothetical protein
VTATWVLAKVTTCRAARPPSKTASNKDSCLVPTTMTAQRENRLVEITDFLKMSTSHVWKMIFQDGGHESLCYKCPICEQAFPSVNSLKVHIFVDHNSPSEPPPDHLERLKSRQDSVASQVFKCHLCGLHVPNQDILHQVHTKLFTAMKNK